MALFCYTLPHSVPLYTLPHIKDTYPALFIMFGSMEFVLFPPITHACLPLNAHRSPAGLTQYLFQYLGRSLVNSVGHLAAEGRGFDSLEAGGIKLVLQREGLVLRVLQQD